MNKAFGWAIVGPGNIVNRFAEAISHAENTRLVAIQGRDVTRAQAFATRWRAATNTQPMITTSLDDVLKDPAVDAVYIATPHAFHANTIRACLLAKKPVLCEKPLVTDAAVARELCELAATQNTFLMEAVWTRFLPLYQQLAAWLREERIGRLRAMRSTFCFSVPFNSGSRLFDPAQAGGALLDIGIYNITVSRWVFAQAFGVAPAAERIEASGALARSGVDSSISATLHFSEGVTSQFLCATDRSAENAFHIIGDAGEITINAGFWEATRATLTKKNGDTFQAHLPFRVNGFEYQIDEAMSRIQHGAIESATMPHAETIAALEITDSIRKLVGVRYPWEPPHVNRM